MVRACVCVCVCACVCVCVCVCVCTVILMHMNWQYYYIFYLNVCSVTANPVFQDHRREDSGIENDDEIVVNKGALEFEDD